ncbi:MAG TPA: SPOR domain-containing protein [Bacteroidota bacterium]|nr:SPOR domain-containing protein [Bacteroidota bacterium]
MGTMKKILMSGFVLCLLPIGAAAQSDKTNEPDIQRRLEMIERGQEEAVKAELPTLITNYQNHPGVLFLQAVLTTDGMEAAKMYQSIVDNFPRSEWADDALYKLYQYYYSIGLYKTADQKLDQLKREYPFSAYAADEPPVRTRRTPAQAQEPPANVRRPGTVEKYATRFTVQVGAFSTLQNAEELKTRFEREGYVSNIFTIVRDGKKLHKVWVGEFPTQEEAKRFSAELKNKFNLESMVVSR